MRAMEVASIKISTPCHPTPSLEERRRTRMNKDEQSAS